MEALESWCVRTGAHMVVGRGLSGARPAWEHRLVGRCLLHLGIALMRLRLRCW